MRRLFALVPVLVATLLFVGHRVSATLPTLLPSQFGNGCYPPAQAIYDGDGGPYNLTCGERAWHVFQYTPFVFVALLHEFGTERMPARSFLFRAFTAGREGWTRAMGETGGSPRDAAHVPA